MRGRTPEILEASRRLRSEMTQAELVLWNAIRREQIPGMRFRRQHALGRFVLDFYCPAHRLALEVDGAVHDGADQASYDAARSDALAHLGIRVLRIRNEDVMTDLRAVVERIAGAARPQANTPSK